MTRSASLRTAGAPRAGVKAEAASASVSGRRTNRRFIASNESACGPRARKFVELNYQNTQTPKNPNGVIHYGVWVFGCLGTLAFARARQVLSLSLHGLARV